MLELTFHNLTAEDAEALIRAYKNEAKSNAKPAAESLPMTATEVLARPIVPNGEPAEANTPAPTTSKKKTTKKKTAKKKVAELTETDIRVAVTELSEARGLEAARDMLGKYNAKRIPELDESDYAAFIADVEAELAE